MSNKYGTIRFATSLFFIILCLTIKAQDKLVLFDFESKKSIGHIKAQDASYEIVKENGNTFLVVNSGFTIGNPGIKLLEPEDKPWNLKKRYQVKADIKNIGNEFVYVEMFVQNDTNEGNWDCSNYIDLYPGESGTITVNLAWTPWVHEPQLDLVGMRGKPGQTKTDLEAINEILICSRYATRNNKFTIDNVRVEGYTEVRDTTGFFPFVDEFGQYIHRDWKGKIHSVEELKESAETEAKDLENNPTPSDLGKYGGWTAGPKLEATGFFRTEKHNDKWWIVDPEGYLFWTSGLNCMNNYYGSTGISHREHYFKNLPDPKGNYRWFYYKSEWSTHGFYKDKTPYTGYAFYMANQFTKYGPSWNNKARELIHTRLRSWGMNTIGFMSDTVAAKQRRTPYVGGIWILNTPKIEASEGYWGPFHDVFDPAFRDTVQISVNRQKFGANDPWCIGYFIDNEMSWGLIGSLAVAALKSPAKQPAKKEFIKDLKIKYGDIEALNKVWKSDYSSWDSMLKRTDEPNLQAAKEDLTIFYRKIAMTYFRTVNEELKKVAPNQNYLGCRFAWAVNDIVVEAAAMYCDIVSFNKYEYSVADLGLPEGVDAPIMIGEFHFGALDRGALHLGLKEARDQEHRGELYKNYIQGALRNKYIVGAHWFQYVDEAITGRGDGENYNVGFINSCDQPYQELIEKVRETNYNMYKYRLEH